MATIYSKIATVKAKFGKLTKDQNNPFFKSKYADINQLIEMTDPVLHEEGLLVMQPIIDGFLVTQIIEVETGKMITSSLKLPESNDPQKVGSAITYFRRYTLKAALNIQEEDDDANKASGKQQQTTAPNKQTATKATPPAKVPLSPGSEKWEEVALWLARQVHKGKFAIELLKKVKEGYDLKKEHESELINKSVEIRKTLPEEAVLTNEIKAAITSAKDLATLNTVYNNNQALHTNKEFTSLYANKQKEIAGLRTDGKEKAA